MIDKYKFGEIVVNGIPYGDDIKIIQGRVIPDWWRAGGHVMDTADIQDIVGVFPDILVIGRGSSGMMRITDECRRFLALCQIELIDEETAAAVRTFNRLYQVGRNVAAGFHLTC